MIAWIVDNETLLERAGRGKILCWLVAVSAIYAYSSEKSVAATVIGVVAVLLFVVDFKVAMSEATGDSRLARVVHEEGAETSRAGVPCNDGCDHRRRAVSDGNGCSECAYEAGAGALLCLQPLT